MCVHSLHISLQLPPLWHIDLSENEDSLTLPSLTVHLLNPEPGCHQGCLLSESLQAPHPIEVSGSSAEGMVLNVGIACPVFFVPLKP